MATLQGSQDASLLERISRFGVLIPIVMGVAVGVVLQSWGAGILAFMIGGFATAQILPGIQRRNPWSGIGYESKLRGKGLADSYAGKIERVRECPPHDLKPRDRRPE